MSQRLLSCRNIVKTFEGITALNQVSFDVQPGEILGLAGVHGAGKTTLINIVSGQYRADSGAILFDDHDITHSLSNELAYAGIARTFQIPRPLASLTVIDNVAVARMSVCDELARKDAIDLSYETLDFVGLGNKARLPVARLHFHERKFLEMARALALKPKLLLLDEVLAGLHPAEVDVGIKLIRRIQASGITVVFVEHNMRAMLQLANRMVVLDGGRTLAEGLTADVLHDKRVIATYLKQDYVQS